MAAGLCAPRPAGAQEVGARQFTVADNLGDNFIEAIHQDSRGYVWFATRDGLSRFDGYSFRTYRVEDGLPHNRTTDVAEDANGVLWVATRAGLARLVDDASDPRARFALVPEASIEGARPGAMLAHPDGALWGLTRSGVMRRAPGRSGAFQWHRVHPGNSGPADPRVFRDREGRVWAMLDRELLVFAAAGTLLARYGAEHGIGERWIVSVAQDRAGRIYAANTRELFTLVPGDSLASSRWQSVAVDLRVPGAEMRWLGFDASDRLWIGTTFGVLWRREGSVTEVTLSQGAGFIEVGLVDRQGNVWLGTHRQGVFRVPAEPVLSFTQRQGFPAGAARRVIEYRDGRSYAVADSGSIVQLSGGRASVVPGTTLPEFAEVKWRVQSDGWGGWWIGTMEGKLFWLPAGPPDYRRAKLVWSAPGYPHHPWWGGPHLKRVRDGTVIVGGPDHQAFRASSEHGVPKLEPLGGLEKLPGVAWAALDAGGKLWLGALAALGRWSNGVLQVIPPPPDIAVDARAHDPFIDSRGWLWVAFREDGVSVSRDPSAASPRFETYRVANGLSSNEVRNITEDGLGRMYFGSPRGLDRLDVNTGSVRRLGLPEGLSGATVMSLTTDTRGRVWVSTSGGVSMIDIDPGVRHTPVPSTLLTRVRIAGEDHPVPARGASVLPPLTLAPGRNNLAIEFVAVSHASDVPLRYRYRLAGQDRDWSPPTESRSVTYAGLGSGTYHFEVSAATADGRSRGEPAVLSFTVVAPIWRRPWFIGAAVLLMMALGAWIHRLRIAQAIAMERLRRQVAFDLHDDVGSGLSEIAILSELAKEEGGRGAAWSEIAGRARSLRESMGDIVWAVDPKHDSLAELVQRMRQIAFNLLETQGLQVSFVAPEAAVLDHIDMAPDRRRNVLLIFKEAIHNVSKHAAARRADIAITLEARRLVLIVQDDGCGFDPRTVKAGHGLPSLQRRSELLGAQLTVSRPAAGGTRVELRAALA